MGKKEDKDAVDKQDKAIDDANKASNWKDKTADEKLWDAVLDDPNKK